MDLDFSNAKQCKFTLSASELRTFCDCPRKRYYSSRDCLAIRETTKSTALQIGSAFHEAIAYYYLSIQKVLDFENIEKPSDYEVEAAYNTVEPYQFPEDAGLTEDDLKTLKNMLECYLPTLLNDLTIYHFDAAEQSFRMQDWPIEDVVYHGSIDLVVTKYEDGKIYYYENKTCKDFRPEIYSRFDIQLHIYDQYGCRTHQDNWGGMILNQVKKSKTSRGYGESRELYQYDSAERTEFLNWLYAKTKALVSPENHHAPCNNYMTCKMCQFMSICMKYGYAVPKTHEEIAENDFFSTTDESGNKMYMYKYDPREEVKDESN